MKFTLSWLKDFLDTSAEVQLIAETLTAIGLEVEDVTDQAAALAGFSVAEIMDASPHPDADKLRVCKVQSDSGELQIVCGAPNARAGIKVALAKIGSVIPNGGFTIKQSKIRGVDSSGMLCSANELGLGDDQGGIIELPATSSVGQSVAEALGLNDPVFEIAITPNRGDCLGVHGIARDLAAAGIGTLKPLVLTSIQTSGVTPIPVMIDDTDSCKMFVGRAIKGVKNGPSPEWLQQRLRAIGLRPISVLVDVTNYMTFSYGRPLHVYDLSKLQGHITARKAIAGEAFDALNDKHYTLETGMCVIADEQGMLGLAGIVGGVPSSVTENTTDILLECAWFDPIHIAENGRKLGIHSDARYRFERTVDPEFVGAGADIATQMIVDLCGGVACEARIAGGIQSTAKPIAIDAVAVNALGGIVLSAADQIAILERLGFAIRDKQSEHYTAYAPSWRPDIEQLADIAEEVLRIYGYDNVPSAPMPKSSDPAKPALNASQKRSQMVRRSLAVRGLHEGHHWAFMAEDKARLFGFDNEDLRLLNPISADLSVMRPSLIPHLVEALVRNAARGQDSLGLFEVGPQFTNCTSAGQQLIACAVRMGEMVAKQWSHDTRVADVFDAKADALAIIDAAGLAADKVQIGAIAPAWYHPGRSGCINLGPKNILGYFGELHPSILKALGCDSRVVACEVMLDAIPQAKSKALSALKQSDYQAVSRDFAFILPENVTADALLRAVAGAEKQLMQQVRLFDLYQGKGLEDGSKSLALSIRLQATDRTLSEADIDAVSQKVIAAAAKIGAKLRA